MIQNVKTVMKIKHGAILMDNLPPDLQLHMLLV